MIGLVLAAALAAEPVAQKAADALDRLQRVYQQSCAERAYGSYNDLCHQMRQDIRRYARDVASEQRRAKPPASVEGSGEPKAPLTATPPLAAPR